MSLINKPLIIKKVTFPSKDTVAAYPLNEKNGHFIFFNKERLTLMYHLLRYSYFDRNILNNIYFCITGKERLSTKWFQSLVGNNRFPISIYTDYKGKNGTKIYYLNKIFAEWLIHQLDKFNDIEKASRTVEGDSSLHSISTNNIFGGKPKTVNQHDYEIRQEVSKIAKRIIDKIHLSSSDIFDKTLFIQYSFPTNRRVTDVLPDATLFVNNVPYNIEYDRQNEKQWQLVSKVYRYSINSLFKGQKTFFIFDVSLKKGKKNSQYLSKRVHNFLVNAEGSSVGDYMIMNAIQESGSEFYSYPKINSINMISNKILSELDFINKDDVVLSDLNSSGGFPFYVNDISYSSVSDFDYFITYENDFFDNVRIPLLRYDYCKVGNISLLKKIKEKYSNEYTFIGLIYDRDIKEQFESIDDKFYIPLYIG